MNVNKDEMREYREGVEFKVRVVAVGGTDKM